MQYATKDTPLLLGKDGLATTQIQAQTPEGYCELHALNIQEWFGGPTISFLLLLNVTELCQRD